MAVLAIGGPVGFKHYSDEIREFRTGTCLERNHAWDRAMDFLLTIIPDDEPFIESLRQAGVVNCEMR